MVVTFICATANLSLLRIQKLEHNTTRSDESDVVVHARPDIFDSNDIVIVCWILRTNSTEDLRRSEAIRFGWGRHCSHLEFIDRTTRGIRADWQEGYDNIAGKSFRAWQLIHKRYVETTSRKLDFALKADLDTYILGGNLRKYLRRLDPSIPHYVGKQLANPGQDCLVAGTAITLSRASLALFSKASGYDSGRCTQKGWYPSAEDVALALCLKDIGVFPLDTRDETGAERFMVLNPDTLRSSAGPLPEWYTLMSKNRELGKACCSAEAIAFHYVTEEQLLWQVPVLVHGEWVWLNRTSEVASNVRV